jgi:transcription initiation factor IIE alpha subunit
MEEILFLMFGNHPKSIKLYEEARKVIEILKEKKEISREELAKLLGLDLNNSTQKKHFYKIISPMFNKILSSERKGRVVYYHLSYDMFRVYLDNLRRKARYYLTGEEEKA